MTLVACTVTLCNTHKLAHSTCQATHEDIITDKFPEERFSVDFIFEEDYHLLNATLWVSCVRNPCLQICAHL